MICSSRDWRFNQFRKTSSQYRRGRVGKGIANTLTTSGQMGVVGASYEGEDKQVYHVAGVLSATIFPPPMLLSVLLTLVVLLIPRQLKED